MKARVCITRAAALTPRGSLSAVDGFAKEPAHAPSVPALSRAGFPLTTARPLPFAASRDLAAVLWSRLAPLPPNADAARVGVFLGAEPERVRVEELSAVNQARRTGRPLAEGEGPDASAYARRSPGQLAAWLAAQCGAQGPRRVFAMACAASAAACAAAWRAISAGELDAALCAGVALNVEAMLFAGFCLLGAMSPGGVCRPFDARRDGFVLADGAGAVWLEAEHRVLAAGRKAEILGYLLGAGESLDAYRMTDPEPQGQGAQAAICAALRHAEISSSEVALVKAHATGTWRNDEAEARALAACVPHDPPILALKGSLGHSIAACGVVELIAALHSLRAGRVEGAFGLSQRDPALAAQNISPFEEGPRALSGRVALCNTFAFGGMNCSLLVGAP